MDATTPVSLVTAIIVLITAWLNNRAIRATLREVKTGNGNTIAALADSTEARRIRADVDPDDRTVAESHQVAIQGEKERREQA